MKKKILAGILTAVMVLAYIPLMAFAGSDTKASNGKYSDVSRHWAHEAISKIADASNFSDKDGKFHPDKAITRSEFAVMLHKALGIKIAYFKATDIKEFFSDVKNEDAYASALYDLVVAKIIDVDSTGKFRPNDALTRQDMVHYIINSLEYMTGGDYAMIMIYPEPFADASDINAAYKNDFVKAQVFKLVNGSKGGKFYPLKKATRAEAATVVYRLLNLLESLKADSKVQVNPSVETCTDSMQFRLTIMNNTDKAIKINHTSGQKYDFALLDADRKEIYRWSADKMFISALTETVIEPGKSADFTDSIKGETYSSIKDKAIYFKAYIIGSSSDFTINPDGYEIKIK